MPRDLKLHHPPPFRVGVTLGQVEEGVLANIRFAVGPSTGSIGHLLVRH